MFFNWHGEFSRLQHIWLSNFSGSVHFWLWNKTTTFLVNVKTTAVFCNKLKFLGLLFTCAQGIKLMKTIGISPITFHSQEQTWHTTSLFGKKNLFWLEWWMGPQWWFLIPEDWKIKVLFVVEIENIHPIYPCVHGDLNHPHLSGR